METLINALIGFVVVPLYNIIKAKLKISGKAAAWLLYGLLFLLAIPLTLAQGGLTGIKFDPGNPVAFMEAVGRAYLIIVGAASGLYAVTKKRVN
jgi:hypothetical protein